MKDLTEAQKATLKFLSTIAGGAASLTP
ncbi:MAG: VENN motif pre-toxin domain-containing protein [Brasilonema octagenarum HA4186-MV1]|uniref:VENN motif-containing domain-containing protein n=2 Tax=Brasilonema TaxID=383614 RepID=A0A856MMS2_9CYAN|nr:VENN motif pre-toxin domain-containing protein [Brasilonema octagenarum HA4186-MV1]NMF62456.1 hypothetical protein [Brasilonema octagenarum UFV-OR1]QDL11968.1 hypothetical protein DP114_32345 [Brasilonema sennae CENA114]QDL18343.1 hypothetical protein DP113_32445 [Brasilonema octagenarum UFV-E1]